MDVPSSQRRRSDRGQTEPLAALVAVALFCVALSVYTGVLTGVVPEFGSDRELAEVTGERVWGAVGENGIYPTETSLHSALDGGVLPRGHPVTVTVTYVGSEGTITTAGQAVFDRTGEVTSATDRPDGESFSRPVPVQHRDGDVRPGTLTVVVGDVE